jgi:hypothetical protein
MRCWKISRYLQDWSRKLASNYRYFSYSPDTAHGFLDPGKGCSFLSWETAMVATFREGGLVAWASHDFEQELEQVDLKRQVAEAKIRGAVELAEIYSAITRHLHAIHIDERRLSLMRYIYFLFRGH